MFQKSNDPITRTGLGIIGTVGVALVAVAVWTTFVPLTDGEADSETVPSADDGPPVGPLPQVGEEAREDGINEIGDTAEPPEGGVDEAEEAPFVEGTEVADAPVTEGEEVATEEIASEGTPPPLEVGDEALTAEAPAGEDAAVAEGEIAGDDVPPPLAVADEELTTEASDDGLDAVVAEGDPAAADAPPPLEVGNDAGADPATAAVGEAEFSEEGMALLTADAEAGARVWNQCRACHVADQEQNRVGPHLVDIVGREIASVEGFRYSQALQNVEATHWTPEELDAWLEDPQAHVPGTTMGYAGLRDPADRANLLTYLHEIHQGE